MLRAQRAKVFQYGSPLKTQRLEENSFELEQLRLQKQFWNALVDIDHKFDQRYQELIDGYDKNINLLNAKVTQINARLKELGEQKKSRRKTARSGRVPVDDILEEIAALTAERKPLNEELKKYRDEAKIQRKPQAHELEAERKALVKSLRQEYAGKGLYWGHYNDILARYLTARSRLMNERKNFAAKKAKNPEAKFPELHFKRFDGSGSWTCQIQKGMTVAQVFAGTDQRFQIDPVPSEAWAESTPRGERRRLSRTRARVRIGFTKDREPQVLEISIIMHRPLPEDALIKSVSVNAKKIGNRISWFLNVVAVTNITDRVDRTGKVVAIDVGWRRTSAGLRVGYWVDNQDKESEILLDDSFIETDERLTNLQQNRDNDFNLAKEKLQHFLATADNLPEWLRESVEHLAQWRACAKLASLVIHWGKNRFNGDQEIYEWLEKNWRRQDKHLWTWRANLREKMMGRRLDYYRVLAKELADKYDVIVVEDFDLRSVQSKKHPEEGVDGDQKIRKRANLAAVGSLRNEIARACAENGKIFEKVDPAYTTLGCPFCGGKIEGSPRANITVACSQCKAVYDQDWGAAKNILKKWLEDPTSKSEPPVLRKGRRFRKRQGGPDASGTDTAAKGEAKYRQKG